MTKPYSQLNRMQTPFVFEDNSQDRCDRSRDSKHAIEGRNKSTTPRKKRGRKKSRAAIFYLSANIRFGFFFCSHSATRRHQKLNRSENNQMNVQLEFIPRKSWKICWTANAKKKHAIERRRFFVQHLFLSHELQCWKHLRSSMRLPPAFVRLIRIDCVTK